MDKESIDKFMNNEIVKNLIKLFVVIFLYKMFDTQFIMIQRLFREYYVLRFVFVIGLLYLLTKDISVSLGLSVFWFVIEYVFNMESDNLDTTTRSRLKSNDDYNKVETSEELPVDYYNNNTFLPNKLTQIKDISLDTYYSQNGSEFPNNQVDVLNLVDNSTNTPEYVPKKNYIDNSNKLLEGFCGSESCAL